MIGLAIFLQALACLLNPPAPFVSEWGWTYGKWLSTEQWAALQQVEGRDLWRDDYSWETTGDERGVLKMVGDGYEVWLFYSAIRQEYDILPFRNTEAFADAQNNHYGLHPCGGWAVDEAIIEAMIDNREGG